jgi:transcription-repair coupling factor (superfamily II helicase)|tara:strand:+ start:11035 stop:14352 length:3318 start_codon:yes stop_codon:yes gene_type:complete
LLEKLLDFFTESVSLKRLKKLLDNNTPSIFYSGSIGSSLAIDFINIIEDSKKNNLFIFSDKEEASYFINDLEKISKKEVFFYPASYRRPYQIEETENTNVLQRAEVLNKLNSKKNTIVITYSEALFEKVISKKELRKQTISLKVNQRLEAEEFEKNLINLNFKSTNFVTDPGQFSVRGGIIDIFSYASEHPIRIELIGDEIESLRTFSVNSQLSIKLENKVKIIPNTEAKYIQNNQVCFLEYFTEDSNIWIKNLNYTLTSLDDNFTKTEEIFSNLEKKSTIFKQNPSYLFSNSITFNNSLVNKTIIKMSAPENKENVIIRECSPLIPFNKNIDILLMDLQKNQTNNIRNIILCSSEEQEERIKNILMDKDQKIKIEYYQILLHEGFIDYDNKVAIYTDHQIFDRHHRFKSKTKFSDKQAITIKQLTSLKIGDYITHIDHGIGQFNGLHKISNNNQTQEVIKLSYRGGDILYISIHALHKIAKFSAKEGSSPKMHQLGTPTWNKSKQKTKNRVKEIAFNLIKLYAKRKSQEGFQFSPDTYLQQELEASFMFEDTPDQSKATLAIKEDMEKIMPMDRLVCGDVGFGKTEIAIRAAFKAVADNKQVAILVPTTILALQHYKTFKKRLAKLPCNVDYLNRFRTKSEQNEILKKIQNGGIDVIIGTHRIVGKDVHFKDLGLLIVDEEQKFGVNIKDKLKAFKTNVDSLTLTATPIPRTLQFSLLGARDLSIINTPPPNRQSIQTNIIGFNEEKIRDAIKYEINRNGQVFFVHNRVENINEIAGFIQRICPDAKIKIGHGQMPGNKIESLMIDFIEGQFDILVSTTIIENGVDIPNANTIIINNAQNFGLSDLHQMRGRVGRSDKQAFCFLISPPLNHISEDSRRRLNALEQFSNIGSGFKIAMRDLDIRGAGDLLGGDQSGFINEIGFEMYQRILAEAVEELKEEKFKNLFKEPKSEFKIKDCQIDTDLEIQIPESYVINIEERIALYKALNDIKDDEELEIFKNNLVDRFGALPKNIFNIFKLLNVKWKAKELGFERIVLKNNNLRAYLPHNQNTNYYQSSSFTKILDYVKMNQDKIKIKEIKEKVCLQYDNILSLNELLTIFKKVLNE